ncbi:MAG TPA: SDR family NAD(P)-dependent oxidoreductase [Frankiaceae bacterium]|jgi:NAD(P)-dependent dehydrogenase (short-subunit alcohol dehydrogenase family)|nr:SDR family NAD(P)-dependent oxidoreductase [Frankiaceae bacterium]
MKSLTGRVAVVTGAGSGLGRAMCQRFGQEGMHVVLADVMADRVEQAAKELTSEGLDVIGVQADVTSQESMNALRDATLATYGAVHVVCNNAGIGAGAEGKLWEHEEADWKWAFAVNLWGVIHGINAFVPAMLAGGDEGHIVNTSSGNGGISPLPSTPQYAVTKGGVVTLTECLYAQLRDTTDKVSASLLFPGPHMMRTGLFESWRTRPETFAKARPRQTPYVTVEALETQMKAAGVTIDYTDPSEVAAQVVDAILADRFWIHAPSQSSDNSVKARTQSLLDRTNPDYLRAVPG